MSAKSSCPGGVINVGIVGLGRAGIGMHAPELDKYPDKFKITAACDTDPKRCGIMKEKYGCKTHSRIEDMLQDPDVELVSVATCSVDHVPHALLSLKSGKHVFLEKPIAVNYTEAKKLVPAAAKAKGKLFLRHNRRFEPGFQHIREIIASGILGEVFEIKLRRNGYSRRDDWQTLKSCAGGQMNNWGPHIVDHALRFLESPVAEMWSDVKKIAAAGDAEDHLKIVLKGENGRVVDLEISGGAAITEPEYIVLGSKGALTSSGNEIKLKYLDPEVKLPARKAKSESPELGSFGSPDNLKWIEKTIPVAPATGCDTHSIWPHMYDSIRNGKTFPITLEEGLEVVKIVTKAKKGTPFA
jgi:predicted dehydrogenase